jgi:hypothetical protein
MAASRPSLLLRSKMPSEVEEALLEVQDVALQLA